MDERELFDPSQLITTRGLRQRGRDLRRPRPDDELTRLRHGVAIPTELLRSLDPTQRYAAFVHATHLMARSAERVFSHYSAAVLWGMPVAEAWPGKAHVTSTSQRAHSSGHLVRHHAEDLQVCTREGLAVTSPARTVADLTCWSGFLTGLTAADYALAAELCTRAQIYDELDRLAPGTRGRGSLSMVAELARAASQSAGESLSRGQMHLLRLPEPILQVRIELPDATYFGDFGWPGVIGEFDGAVKYGATYNASPEEAYARVREEKEREDQIRSVRYEVARWGWKHAFAGAPMARILADRGIRPAPRRLWVRLDRDETPKKGPDDLKNDRGV